MSLRHRELELSSGFAVTGGAVLGLHSADLEGVVGSLLKRPSRGRSQVDVLVQAAADRPPTPSGGDALRLQPVLATRGAGGSVPAQLGPAEAAIGHCDPEGAGNASGSGSLGRGEAETELVQELSPLSFLTLTVWLAVPSTPLMVRLVWSVAAELQGDAAVAWHLRSSPVVPIDAFKDVLSPVSGDASFCELGHSLVLPMTVSGVHTRPPNFLKVHRRRGHRCLETGGRDGATE